MFRSSIRLCMESPEEGLFYCRALRKTVGMPMTVHLTLVWVNVWHAYPGLRPPGGGLTGAIALRSIVPCRRPTQTDWHVDRSGWESHRRLPTLFYASLLRPIVAIYAKPACRSFPLSGGRLQPADDPHESLKDHFHYSHHFQVRPFRGRFLPVRRGR